MASGYSNHLTKQVGEFLVCAELGRRKLVATTFAGNVPGYDVVATSQNRRSVLIQVKTAQWAVDKSYCFNLTGRFLDISTDPQTKKQSVNCRALEGDEDLIHVFVLLRQEGGGVDRFFICEGKDVQRACYKCYVEYMEKHSYTRPKNPESKENRLRPSDLAFFENRWDLIENRLSDICV